VGCGMKSPTRWTSVTRWVSVVLLSSTIWVVGTGPLSAQEGTDCDDGRAWTRDTQADNFCLFENICTPTEITLTASPDIRWSWTFPSNCPQGAIDAIGVVLQRRVALDPLGDLSLGTRTRIESHGTANPEQQGAGSVSASCGAASLSLLVLAGTEIVATGSGNVETAPCPDTDVAPPEQGLLGPWTDAQGRSGGFARLYWAVFGRLPDADGFDYWSARATAGMTIRDAGDIWVDLGEWQAIYGGTSDTEFLQRIYQNVLGRGPDAGGLDYWTTRLSDDTSRSEVVTLFSDSSEFRQRTLTG
jgi:hypothetical protein